MVFNRSSRLRKKRLCDMYYESREAWSGWRAFNDIMQSPIFRTWRRGRSIIRSESEPDERSQTLTYFCISHSRLSSGHTLRVFSQRDIQWKWNACCWTSRSVQLAVHTRQFGMTTSVVRVTVDQSRIRTLHIPHAALHSSLVDDTWLA